MTPGMRDLHPLRGFLYPYRGVRFLFRRPALLGYAAVPFAVSALLYAGFAWFAGASIGRWIDRWVPQGDAWYWTVLYYGVWAAAAAVALLVVAYTFTAVGNLLLAPFNDLLSERVERAYAGRGPDEPFRLSGLASEIGRSFRAEAARLAVLGSGFLVLLVLSWAIPPVGLVLTVYTLFLVGWEYFDYSTSRWRLPFSSRAGVAARNAASFLGFGAGAALLLAVPLLNFLAVPACVAGATLLFCDLRDRGRIPGGRGAVAPASAGRITP